MDDAQKAYEDELKAYRKELRASYEAGRKLLNDASISIAGFYDKGMVFTTGGAVAISLVFIEKVSPNPRGYALGLVAAAWTFLAFGLLFHLLSLSYSQSAVRRQLDILESDYRRISEAPPGGPIRATARTNKYSKYTTRLSKAAIGAVIMGVGFLGFFFIASINVRKENKNGSFQSAPATPATPAAAAAPAAPAVATNSTVGGQLYTSDVSIAASTSAASAKSAAKEMSDVRESQSTAVVGAFEAGVRESGVADEPQRLSAPPTTTGVPSQKKN